MQRDGNVLGESTEWRKYRSAHAYPDNVSPPSKNNKSPQYILRVTIQPPKEMLASCPSFEHDELLQITTDPFGALERELMATGGLPTPALALAPDLRQQRASVA